MAAVGDAPDVAHLRWTPWAALAVLAGFAILDLCGRPRAEPLPDDAAVAARAAAVGDAGTTVVSFESLAAAPLPWPEAGAPAPSPPPAVAALDGRRVAVAGYMLPTESEGSRVRRFVLCRWAGGCCFSGAMEPDDLIECDVAGEGGAVFASHVPVVVVGTFRVRAAGADLAGGLYRLEDCAIP